MEERQSLCWLAEKSWCTQGLETVCEEQGLHSYRQQRSRLRIYIADTSANAAAAVGRNKVTQE